MILIQCAKTSAVFQADLTGLMYASFHNHPDVAMALIEAGCELNSVGTVSYVSIDIALSLSVMFNYVFTYQVVESGALFKQEMLHISSF